MMAPDMSSPRQSWLPGTENQAAVVGQRREGLLEEVHLAAQAAVREVARRNDVLDVRLDQRGAQARGVRIVLGATTDV